MCRERERDIHLSIYIYTYMYICIYLINNVFIVFKQPWGTMIVYFQFRRRHDYPPHKTQNVWSNLPRILKECGFVFDRRRIDVLTTYIQKVSEILCLVKTTKMWFCLLTATA